MSQPVSEATEFRPRLLAIAYRMLGTVADAEDAVQDAYVRFQQAGEVDSPEGWLVKATTRICIDRLRHAKRRQEYVGPWLPEPVSERWDGAADDRLELAESLSMAFLVLLETLSPAERAAYLLREVFGYEFEEIAALLDKSPTNVRQIASRAKKRLSAGERRFPTTAGRADELSERFLAACRSGDVGAVEALLAEDAVLYSDGGGKVFAAPRPVRGVHRIAKLLATVFRKVAAVGEVSLTMVNGRPGAVFTVGGRTTEVFSFALGEDGAVNEVYVVLNPDKLARWPVPE